MHKTSYYTLLFLAFITVTPHNIIIGCEDESPLKKQCSHDAKDIPSNPVPPSQEDIDNSMCGWFKERYWQTDNPHRTLYFLAHAQQRENNATFALSETAKEKLTLELLQAGANGFFCMACYDPEKPLPEMLTYSLNNNHFHSDLEVSTEEEGRIQPYSSGLAHFELQQEEEHEDRYNGNSHSSLVTMFERDENDFVGVDSNRRWTIAAAALNAGNVTVFTTLVNNYHTEPRYKQDLLQDYAGLALQMHPSKAQIQVLDYLHQQGAARYSVEDTDDFFSGYAECTCVLPEFRQHMAQAASWLADHSAPLHFDSNFYTASPASPIMLAYAHGDQFMIEALESRGIHLMVAPVSRDEPDSDTTTDYKGRRLINAALLALWRNDTTPLEAYGLTTLTQKKNGTKTLNLKARSYYKDSTILHILNKWTAECLPTERFSKCWQWVSFALQNKLLDPEEINRFLEVPERDFHPKMGNCEELAFITLLQTMPHRAEQRLIKAAWNIAPDDLQKVLLWCQQSPTEYASTITMIQKILAERAPRFQPAYYMKIFQQLRSLNTQNIPY